MEDELQAEVRQFAAQLGLAPGSGGGDFSDFDPKKAKKAVAKQPSKSAPKQGKEKNGPAKAAKGGDRRPQGKPQAAAQDGMPSKKWEHRGDRVQAASMNGTAVGRGGRVGCLCVCVWSIWYRLARRPETTVTLTSILKRMKVQAEILMLSLLTHSRRRPVEQQAFQRRQRRRPEQWFCGI